MNKVFSHGKWVETDTITPPAVARLRRKPFKTQFVLVPTQWIETLSQTKRTSTWQLAMVILAEAFKRKLIGGEIVLSSQMTRMSGTTRLRAARELASLGLIQLEIPNGKRALKVLAVRNSVSP
jgi:hypothetical protein